MRTLPVLKVGLWSTSGPGVHEVHSERSAEAGPIDAGSAFVATSKDTIAAAKAHTA